MNLYDKEKPGDQWAFEKFGEKAMKKVNLLAHDVALRISVMDGGDRCEYLEVGAKATAKEPIIFADFSDGIRMWFRGSDIENPHICRWDGPLAVCPW